MAEKRNGKSSDPEKTKVGETVGGKISSKGAARKSSQVAMHKLIGEKLRAHYEIMAREPIPQRFEQLLAELEAKTRGINPKAKN